MTEIYENIIELICPVCRKVFVPAVMHVYRTDDGRPVCSWGCLCAYRRNKGGGRGQGVLQFTPAGAFAGAWKNAGEAAAACGVDAEEIRACCEKRRETCGGYLWRYKNSPRGGARAR